MGHPDMADTKEAGAPKDKSLGDRHTMSLLGMIHGYWISQVVRAAADLRLADHLAAGGVLHSPDRVCVRSPCRPVQPAQQSGHPVRIRVPT